MHSGSGLLTAKSPTPVETPQEVADSDASSLGFANLGGVYLVMFVGSCFGSVYGLINCLVSIYLSARENKVTARRAGGALKILSPVS